MVEGMSVVVNVMLSLMSVMSPTPGSKRHNLQAVELSQRIQTVECNKPTSCLVQPIGRHGGEVMYVGCVCFRGELGFLNCDNIGMCVVNKQFELLEFVFDSVYVDLQYDEISLTSTAGSESLWCVCSHVGVFGGYLRILGAPSVQSCCTLSMSASYRVFVCDRYRKSRLVCVWLSDLDLSRHHLIL